MKLKINRFWSDDVKQAIKNEDYLLNRYCLIPKYNYIINQYNYLFNIFIDNSRFVPNLGVIGQFTSREITITVSKDMFTNIAQTIAPNEGDASSEPVQPLNDELIGKTLIIKDEINYKKDNVNLSETQTKCTAIIKKIEDNDTSGQSKITLYDGAVLFDTPYTPTVKFPCTPLALASDATIKSRISMSYTQNGYSCAHDGEIAAKDYYVTLDDVTFKITIENNAESTSSVWYDTLCIYKNNDTWGIVRHKFISPENKWVDGTASIEVVELTSDIELSTDLVFNTSYIACDPTKNNLYLINGFINANPYTETIAAEDGTSISATSCRKVMQDVAKSTATFCIIDANGDPEFLRLNTKLPNDTTHIGIQDYYKSSVDPNTIKPLNKIVVGLQDIEGENVSYTSDDYTSENESALYIYDNDLTYTPELRTASLDNAKYLIGLTYTPVKIDLRGFPWIEDCVPIIFKNVDNEEYTSYAFDTTETYKGYLIQTLDSTGKSTGSNGGVTHDDSFSRALNQVKYIVDKANGVIKEIVSKQTILGDQQQKLQTSVETLTTDTYRKTEIKKILTGNYFDENGNKIVSEIVQTTSGTFDENGMLYEKTNAPTNTRINEIGVKVDNAANHTELLFAGYDKETKQTVVRSDNMEVKHFFVLQGKSRLEDYSDGTGVFWVGD